MKIKQLALIVATCACSLATTALADGTDMCNGYFESRHLFTPHPNHCDSSTEAFITVGANNDGFCIEKNERTAQVWEDARQTCASLNKRLPEPGEFKLIFPYFC